MNELDPRYGEDHESSCLRDERSREDRLAGTTCIRKHRCENGMDLGYLLNLHKLQVNVQSD